MTYYMPHIEGSPTQSPYPPVDRWGAVRLLGAAFLGRTEPADYAAPSKTVDTLQAQEPPVETYLDQAA